MKIKTAMKELESMLPVLDDITYRDIKDVLESLAFEFYSQGYEDAKVDYVGEPEPFTAYGRTEDFE